MSPSSVETMSYLFHFVSQHLALRQVLAKYSVNIKYLKVKN